MARGTYVWILTVLATATSVRAGCLQTSGMTDPIVMMCKDGYSYGSSIYIDTSAASGTYNEPGPVCTCSVEIMKANFLNITTQHSREICGSKLIFSIGSTNETFNGTGSCKEASFRKSLSQKDSLVIDLEKIETPFDADYCIHLKTETCEKDQFHCVKDGTCISEDLHCDSFPDCSDGWDEKDCGTTTCSEGQVLCASGDKCYSEDKRCDNVTDCTDGSDEFNCGSGGVTTTLAPETGPVIYVNCTESTRFTTTTSTTTTTTPTTTTTTPSTTTPITTTRQTTTISAAHTTSSEEDVEIEPDDKMKPGVIAAIVGSLVALIILVVIVACVINQNSRVRKYILKRRESKYKKNEEKGHQLEEPIGTHNVRIELEK